MKVCAVSFKECWRDADGHWCSDGGFPLQMAAIGSMFDSMDLLIVRVEPRSGGLRLPGHANVIALPKPRGSNARRKLSVIMRAPHYLSVLKRHIRRADVVHVPLPGDIPLLAFFVALTLRKRLIARYGSSWAANSQTTWMNRFTKACLRHVAGGRNAVFVTGAEELPRPLRSIFATALSETELNGIRADLNREISRPPRLVYVGRLSEEKGVAHLVEAIARLRRESFDPLPEVTIVGDGPARNRLLALVDGLACADRINFAGQLNRAGVSEHLAGADLCVQPSLTEGFSKAWLDAMAHGVPVIASDVGAARYAIGGDGRRGWLVPPGNVEALTAALQRAIQEPRQWPALRNACRRFAQEHTLERWQTQIAHACAEQWEMLLVKGKLRTIACAQEFQ